MTTENRNHDVDLRGQVALVTGGGRGLGRAFAQGLAEAGAAVAVLARTGDEVAETASLIAEEGGRAIALTADVTDRDAVERAVTETERQLGPIDLLVNNAGIVSGGLQRWAVAEADPDRWWRVIEVNVRGPYLCARSVLPGMISRRRGRIVNLASAAGLGPGGGGFYSLSKAAVIRFTDILAVETREFGISVFAIHPGNLRTPMNLELRRECETYTPGPLSPQAHLRVTTWIREHFDEIASVSMERPVRLVLLLASGGADALTGRYISVDDDLADLVRRAEEIQRNDLYVLRLRT
jgi:NAD(P)-dependent dehydrogenase (short-subunit alcohol dehydrogenase family)